MQTNQDLFDELAGTYKRERILMSWERYQAHNKLTFGDGYATTGPCWQQHNTGPALAENERIQKSVDEWNERNR